MAFLKKYIPKKARSTIRKVAKKYLKVRRSPYTKSFMKGGVPSTTAIAKALSNLKSKVNTVAEYKLLDHNHTTGSPDVALRQYYGLSASANQSTIGDTTTPGTRGYFLLNVNMPTRGDDVNNFDGKRYHVSSIQWKGTLFSSSTSDTFVRLMLVSYADEDADPFQMNEFLNVDVNGEYSTQSKRNFDYKNYKVIGSRNIKLAGGTGIRKDFNMVVKPRQVIRHFQGVDYITNIRYFLVGLCSPDIAGQTALVNYCGNTRMRFIA